MTIQIEWAEPEPQLTQFQKRGRILVVREMTGASFQDCKKALEEYLYDIADAARYIRRKGLA